MYPDQQRRIEEVWLLSEETDRNSRAHRVPTKQARSIGAGGNREEPCELDFERLNVPTPPILPVACQGRDNGGSVELGMIEHTAPASRRPREAVQERPHQDASR
jgi:hypothetical protein